MGQEYDYKLCDERHENINRRLNGVETDMSDLAKVINGKFNKIVCMFIGVQFTVIGSLIVFIVTRGN